jgi:hypothetical protein
MLKLILLAMFFSQTLSAHCNPLTNLSCKKYTGIMSATGVHFKIPQGYFYSRQGLQKSWLIADSKGTWRIRVMNWMKMSEAEVNNHFHQRGQSSLETSGPSQYMEIKVNAGLYQHQVECEDDCTNKSFEYYVEVP